MNYLFTYPRSGNSAIGYYIRFLYDKLTLGIKGTDNRDKNPKFASKILTRKAHFLHQVNIKELEKLIVVIRDYKECIVSHFKRDSKNKDNLTTYFDKHFKYYSDIIKLYHKYDGPKIFIYYEDLLKNTKTELEKLIDFLGLKTDKLDELIDNLDYHNRIQTNVYEKNTGRVFSGSLSFNKHQKELTKVQIKHFDEHAKKSGKCKRYLKRYYS